MGNLRLSASKIRLRQSLLNPAPFLSEALFPSCQIRPGLAKARAARPGAAAAWRIRASTNRRRGARVARASRAGATAPAGPHTHRAGCTEMPQQSFKPRGVGLAGHAHQHPGGLRPYGSDSLEERCQGRVHGLLGRGARERCRQLEHEAELGVAVLHPGAYVGRLRGVPGRRGHEHGKEPVAVIAEASVGRQLLGIEDPCHAGCSQPRACRQKWVRPCREFNHEGHGGSPCMSRANPVRVFPRGL